MIFSQKLTTLKRLHSWIFRFQAPLVLFLSLLIYAGNLGLSDDEAYYWVLAQKPAWGYAYHPPMVAWMIALFQTLLGWMVQTPSALLVRIPGIVSMTLILVLTLNWLDSIGYPKERLSRAGWILLSFPGLIGLSWMMVPDLPLFLGWTLGFVSVWRICFQTPSRWTYFFLFLSALLLILSKYSGVLAAVSAFICLFFWAPQSVRWKGIRVLTFGSVLALFPILIWNSQHGWASLLYQFRDRHAGEVFSILRWLKFWLAEIVLAGPVLVGAVFYLFKRAYSSNSLIDQKLARFILIWTLPAALVYCFQPLFAHFKLHWVFIVWWPALIFLAWMGRDLAHRWVALQVKYGLILVFLILSSGYVPWMSWVSLKAFPERYTPTWDVSHDLYGWSELAQRIQQELGSDVLELPVLASRYQTASQAAFALSHLTQVSLMPRDLKEQDEWPTLSVSESQGPSWPKLTQSVLYISDLRYSEPPHYPGVECQKLKQLNTLRWGILAKSIDLWRCDPISKPIEVSYHFSSK